MSLPPVLAGITEHYEDAVLYDYEYRRRRDDVRFYAHVAGELMSGPGPILELACGSGRVTSQLLRAGHSVVGLDLSEPMLVRARRRITRLGRAARSRAWLIRADMRSFCLGRRFPLAIMAFNSFEHLYTRVEVEACLARVREHLEPGGHLVFDVQNPDLRWLERDPDKRWARTRFTHPETGESLIYSTNHDYDPVSQIVVIRLFYASPEGPERVVHLSQRKFFPAELESLVAHNGFRVVARFGDFDGGPLHGDCGSQVLVCQVADSTPSDRAKPGETAEIMARCGVARHPGYLYYVQKGRVFRDSVTPQDGQVSELVADPGIALDDELYVHVLDARGHIVRVPRSS